MKMEKREERKITLGQIRQKMSCVETGLVYIFTGEDEIHEFARTGEVGNLQPYAVFTVGTNMNRVEMDSIFNETLWDREIEYFLPVKRDVLAVLIELPQVWAF